MAECNKIKASDKVYYKGQFAITERNKKAKLGRHIRNHPGDVQACAYGIVKHTDRWVGGNLANATIGGFRRAKRNLDPSV